MKYYYEEKIKDLLPQCPPPHYNKKDRICYRWVFESIENDDNFKAQADKNPSIINSKDDKLKCDYYALSFHDTLENSKNAFEFLQNTVKNAKKRLGNHIAKGKIDNSDGVAEEPNNRGHFNLHPSQESNFGEKFVILEEL
ncbi:hypothetical protein [Leeuwenhoekiella marinoflava]|uniref:Uncharacterized protein n=2 Tax=Leeuwenhoekiella marinoflava TaxID=988 RepID=A0A4Q0PM75_9FLAO|nr:hypothetical protein [Leeuwenhoekiella marinoflava]RXG28449.1 hypothetical protein DSL99_2450 [Leeuwenhoekiella marinoflava]SHF52127.1 hypothetical protein SAMN02745246_02741 [Leeuwenhoekiella marinoflava DSM 3653]